MPLNDEAIQLIDFLVHKHNASGLAELSKAIGISRTTLSQWRSGKRRVSERSLDKLRDLANPVRWGSPEFVAQNYMAYNTTAFDVAGRMYNSVASDGDPMMLIMASVSIQAKLAGIVAEAVPSRLQGMQAVACIKALYGDPDAASTCEYTFVGIHGVIDKSVLFSVRVAQLGGAVRFMHTLSLLDNGLYSGSSSGITTDLSLERAVTDIIRFIKPRK